MERIWRTYRPDCRYAGRARPYVSRYSTRHRINLNVDVRTQTNYGTLRAFGSIHMQNEDGVFSNNAARAFIQWAGFTIGHAQSFSDHNGTFRRKLHYTAQFNNSKHR